MQRAQNQIATTHPNHYTESHRRAGFCRHLRLQNALDKWKIWQFGLMTSTNEFVSLRI